MSLFRGIFFFSRGPVGWRCFFRGKIKYDMIEKGTY